jgi:high affinity sulfate transporter 1
MYADERKRPLASIFPPLRWLRGYQSSWLKPDTIAGISLAAYALPVSMAYASLAGLPPQSGIYCYLIGGLCYALLGSSRQLAVGPTSAISLLIGFSAGQLVGGDPSRLMAIAALTALMVAAMSAIAWLFRLSALVNFISDTVLLGFKAGAGITIAMTQLPKLLGVPGGGKFVFQTAWAVITQLPQTNLITLACGLVALGLLIAGGRFLPGRPVVLFVVILAIAVAATTPLGHALKTIGDVPRGLPAFGLPVFNFSDVNADLPIALACFLLAYIEGVSTARTLARKNGDDIDARQVLLGLSAANLGVAFAQGYPVAGGLSQSAVNDKAGAKTPLALVFASIAIAICLLFLTPLLRDLPVVVLAAIVLFAVGGLLKLTELRRLQSISPVEFWLAMVALAGVLLLGILEGVLIAAALSLLVVIASAARPHIAFLGRIPGTGRYSDQQRHPDNQSIAGLLIFRPEGAIVYFNADHVQAQVFERARSVPGLRLVIADLSAVPGIDIAGATMLGTLESEIETLGARLHVAEPRARVRDLLRRAGLEEKLGGFSRRTSLHHAVAEFEAG